MFKCYCGQEFAKGDGLRVHHGVCPPPTEREVTPYLDGQGDWWLIDSEGYAWALWCPEEAEDFWAETNGHHTAGVITVLSGSCTPAVLPDDAPPIPLTPTVLVLVTASSGE